MRPEKGSLLEAQNLPRLGATGLTRNSALVSHHLRPRQGQRGGPRGCVTYGWFDGNPKKRLS